MSKRQITNIQKISCLLKILNDDDENQYINYRKLIINMKHQLLKLLKLSNEKKKRKGKYLVQVEYFR